MSTLNEIYDAMRPEHRKDLPLYFRAGKMYQNSGYTRRASDDLAERLLRDAMAMALTPLARTLHSWDGMWKVRMPKMDEDQPADEATRYTWTPNFPTAIDALHAAYLSAFPTQEST